MLKLDGESAIERHSWVVTLTPIKLQESSESSGARVNTYYLTLGMCTVYAYQSYIGTFTCLMENAPY